MLVDQLHFHLEWFSWSPFITMRATCSLQMRTMLKKLRRLQSVGKVSTSPLCLHWKSLLGFYTMFINLYREWFYLAYSVENFVFFLFRFFCFFLQNCWLISPSGSLTRCSFNFWCILSSFACHIFWKSRCSVSLEIFKAVFSASDGMLSDLSWFMAKVFTSQSCLIENNRLIVMSGGLSGILLSHSSLKWPLIPYTCTMLLYLV